MNRRGRLTRLLRTVRHLRAGQIGWRVWYRLRPTPRTSDAPAPPRRPLSGLPGDGLRTATLQPRNTFTFLGETRRFERGVRWLDAERGKLWTYNLHYFDCLGGAGRADVEREKALIDDWIDANEYATGDGWEPYPTSLRLVNWMRWAWARGDDVDARTLDSLARQTRWLARNLERHILANHLFANLKALLHAGLFFGGAEGDRWLASALAGLDAELDEQLLPDGGHFERSPMYQATLINDLLDLVELADAARVLDAATLDRWHACVRDMLDWQRAMTHPDGDIAFFNDAAIGIAPTTDALVRRATRLRIERAGTADRAVADTVHLEPSGYVRARRGEAILVADVAPVGPDHQPGHAHADTLSFELSIGAQRLVVNSGTSTYVPGPERDEQRRTRSHSTVEIDGSDSSETWSGFRVGRRARVGDVVLREDEDGVSLSAAHDGYRHLPGRVTHRRHWRLEAGRLSVVDELEGRWRSATARLFLHPDVEAGADGRLSVRGRPLARLDVTDGALAIVRTRWHPRFGLPRDNLCVEIAPRTDRLRVDIVFDVGGD